MKKGYFIYILLTFFLNRQVLSQCQTYCSNPGLELGNLLGWTFLAADTLKTNYPGYFKGPQLAVQAGQFDTVLLGAGVQLPTVNPGSGNHSLMVGDSYAVYGGKGTVSYSFSVTPNLADFYYSYAAVIHDGGHAPADQPYFSISFFDQNNQLIPCGYYKVVAGGSIPGFVQAYANYAYPGYNYGFNNHSGPVYYKPWSKVYVDLSPYIGQCVRVEFETSDCGFNGHFSYAYVDMECLNIPPPTHTPLSCNVPLGYGYAPQGALSYNWSGAGIAAGQTNDTVTVNQTGVYTVSMSLAGGCSKTIQTTIGYDTLFPKAEFTTGGFVCSGGSLQFTNTSSVAGINNISWAWDFTNDGFTDNTSMNPTQTFTVPGATQIKLTASNGICTDDTLVTISVGTQPVAAVSVSNVCEYDSLILLNQSTGATSYIWNVGGIYQSTTTATNVHIPNLQPGNYTATVVAANGASCFDTTQIAFQVYEKPNASFTATGACFNQAIPFVNTSSVTSGNINSWNWDLGDGTLFSQQTIPAHSYANDTTYTISLIVATDNGCSDTAASTISVYPLPVVNFTGTNLVGCSQLCVNLQDSSSISLGSVVNYLWSFSNGTQVSGASSNECLIDTGFYSVTLTATSDKGCVASNSKNNYITVHPGVVADFVTDKYETNELDPEVQFNNLSVGATFYTWHFGDGLSDTTENSSHFYSVSNISSAVDYYPTLIVTNAHGCTDSITKKITVNPYYQLFIPNAFTPNGDNVNDKFDLKGIGIKEFNLVIYNRWGEFIWETNDITSSWDGVPDLLTQSDSQVDVYVWMVNVKDVFGVNHKEKGHVTLLR